MGLAEIMPPSDSSPQHVVKLVLPFSASASRQVKSTVLLLCSAM